ncbi:hypothetical protein KM043_015145 [Ampulex compressa]|nr:hypothetical protein KM043_015145 [Ampulex compressa]
MLRNYETNEMLPLQGHQNAVSTMSISRDGKWLLTADFAEDYAVVVWDTESGMPICTLFNPHGKEGMTAARISPNAKYVVTIGNEKCQRVYFWLWTCGRDRPDGSLELTETLADRAKEISFDENRSEYFVLTMDNNVIFLAWEDEKLKYCRARIIGKIHEFGTFNASCFVPKAQTALTATSTGFILVWKSTRSNETKSDIRELDAEEKKHAKSIRLQKSNITVILHHDGMIVTGNSEGRISFYDPELRILYWCQRRGLNSIASIGFDLRSNLLEPLASVSESEFEFSNNDSAEYEEEYDDDDDGEFQTENSKCKKKITYLKNEQLKIGVYQEKLVSKLTVNLENIPRKYSKESSRNKGTTDDVGSFHEPVDATLKHAPFKVGRFFVSTSEGEIALIDITELKCHFISHRLGGAVTSIDVHPESKYVIVGTAQGLLHLYDYEKRVLIISKSTPPLPDFRSVLDEQEAKGKITYVTCPLSHATLTAVTLLKYSPKCDMLVCGLENGALWMLHPISLEPLDNTPYKHSSESILKLDFSEGAWYMAYADNALLVAVFERSILDSLENTPFWNFVGKYHSHCSTINGLLFGPPSTGCEEPCLFSLGEDQVLVEYDLRNSGPYPDPGLKILKIDRVESSATPLSLSWYPSTSVETFLIISNSEYKYKLLNDMTRMNRGTFLGPSFRSPVQHFKVLFGKNMKNNGYAVFATDKEIGLQLLPLDGNPYKAIGMIGHPRKITAVSINSNGEMLFTSGYNDPCVLMWKIKLRSVNVMARLGGKGLSPFYCLIDGGRNSWLIKEMQDLFYYAQLLHQGEHTTTTRIVSDKVSTKQIPNLMRAIGYYPSNEELENMLGEVSYRHYAETGQLEEYITFEDFVKLYINHRPIFGISMSDVKEAFQAFYYSDREMSGDEENPVLTREQFVDILCGEISSEFPEEDKPFVPGKIIADVAGVYKVVGSFRVKETYFHACLAGEPLTLEEANMYLKLLVPGEDDTSDVYIQRIDQATPSSVDFSFLPQRISYKDFTMDIMGIELPE